MTDSTGTSERQGCHTPGGQLKLLLSELREATRPPHKRLHEHEGFAAVARGDIDRSAYAALLSRLWGFYIDYEPYLGLARERSRWLEADLMALGMTANEIERLPRVAIEPGVADPLVLLGGAYVIEGAALGGQVLAKALTQLPGTHEAPVYRFFIGRGSGTGATWRAFLMRLDEAATSQTSRARIVSGAVVTFAVFEQWLTDWKLNVA